MTTPTSTDRDALLLVLRQRRGEHKADESLALSAPIEVGLPGGRVETATFARYDLIGDLQLRLLRQNPDSWLALHTSELDELALSAEEAVALALANFKRSHGEPAVEPWHNLQRVVSAATDEVSNYFLDRPFWRALLAMHPDGLVVALPRTDALLFAPAGDTAAVDSMRRGIPGLHAGGADYQLSSALYLFKDDRWSVLQPAVPVPVPAAAEDGAAPA